MTPSGDPSAKVAAVHLSLLTGNSAQKSWRFTSKFPRSRISVGADVYCHWQLIANGVAPIHCELSWDGVYLWICEVSQPDTVWLNGQAVRGWQQVGDGARIRMGEAEISVSCMQLVDDGADVINFPEPGGASPRMLSMPTVLAPASAPGQPYTPSAPVGPPMGSPPAPMPAAPAPAAARPRYGLHEAPTIIHNPDQPPPDPRGVQGPAGYPGYSYGPPPQAPGQLSAPVGPVPGPQLPEPPLPHPAPVYAPPAAAQPSMTRSQSGQLSAEDSSTRFPRRDSMFMYPPELPKEEAPAQDKFDFRREAAKLWASVRTSAKKINKRTWLMMAGILIAGVFLLLPDDDEPAQTPGRSAPTALATPATAAGKTQGGKTEGASATDRDDESDDDGVVQQPLTDKDVANLEKQAVDYTITARYKQARRTYKTLAKARPANTVYPSLVKLLTRRIKERCAELGDTTCEL